jgi:hypothetical protein
VLPRVRASLDGTRHVAHCDHLPPLDGPAYYLEWGMPLTAQRLKKMANTLAALSRNAKRRDAISYASAIGDWETSSLGARLAFISTAAILDTFELTVDEAHLRRRCRVVWRSHSQLGVEFQESLFQHAA